MNKKIVFLNVFMLIILNMSCDAVKLENKKCSSSYDCSENKICMKNLCLNPNSDASSLSAEDIEKFKTVIDEFGKHKEVMEKFKSKHPLNNSKNAYELVNLSLIRSYEEEIKAIESKNSSEVETIRKARNYVYGCMFLVLYKFNYLSETKSEDEAKVLKEGYGDITDLIIKHYVTDVKSQEFLKHIAILEEGLKDIKFSVDIEELISLKANWQ